MIFPIDGEEKLIPRHHLLPFIYPPLLCCFSFSAVLFSVLLFFFPPNAEQRPETPAAASGPRNVTALRDEQECGGQG